MTHLRALLLGLLAVAGCGGGNGATGTACGSNDDCAGKLCLPYQDGYCSADCSAAACGDGELCKTVQGTSACFVACSDASGCRAGYQCWQGACVPACGGDGDCGLGFVCASGQCMTRPGKPVGDACASDNDCSSQLCDPNTGKCQLSCLSDASCPTGQTCWVNPVDTNGDRDTDSIKPYCIPTRGTGALGASCRGDGDCDRGQCELGVCVTVCQATGECASGSVPMACTDMIAAVDNGGPTFKGCLMKQGELVVDYGQLGGGQLGLPSTAQGFNIFTATSFQSTSIFAGVVDLSEPGGRSLYAVPQTQADFFTNPIRYQPSEGVSMMLVSNDPSAVQVKPGLYDFTTGTSQQAPFNTQVRIKIAPSPPTSGSIPLHVFVTNLAGNPSACNFNAATAPGKLAAVENTFKQIYASAGLTIGPIQYFDSSAPNQFTSTQSGVDTGLDAELKAATAGDQPDVLEATIVKFISGGQQGFEVLGISGGIPAATGIPGTIHSGVVVSTDAMCSQNGSTQELAITLAHELGHSMGLWHSEEQDGTKDQITDNDGDGQNNLMYWLESSPTQTHISMQQGMVLLANPAVK